MTSLVRAPFRLRRVNLVLALMLVLGATYLASGLTRGPLNSRPSGALLVGPDLAAVGAPTVGVPTPGANERLLARYARAIDAWASNVASNPGDNLSATNLGTVYVGRARLTGDLGDYQRAMAAVDRALAIAPDYLPTRELRATILFAIHDFAGARAEANQVLEVDPTRFGALAVSADASLELGDIETARAEYATLADVAASPPVWSRLAHLAFLDGDTDRAIGLAERSVEATTTDTGPEAAAFYAFQLGTLYLARGNLDGAAAAFGEALTRLPGHVPATAGLARVREAQGRRAEAIALLEAATARVPQPELVAALGDLYALDGDRIAAQRQYALVERIGEVGRAVGSVYDRQLILFAADHDRGIEAALATARASLSVRADLYGHDALAWVLFKAGQLDEAASEAALALALGTQDPRLAYHAGMIAAALGHTAEARELLAQAVAGSAYLPPLQVPIAERALADLSGVRP